MLKQPLLCLLSFTLQCKHTNMLQLFEVWGGRESEQLPRFFLVFSVVCVLFHMHQRRFICALVSLAYKLPHISMDVQYFILEHIEHKQSCHGYVQQCILCPSMLNADATEYIQYNINIINNILFLCVTIILNAIGAA